MPRISLHRTVYRISIHCLITLALLSVTNRSSLADFPESTAQMQNDATLNDVFFQGPDIGWAVGDRGIILMTNDGGRSWSKQPSQVQCRLQSVYFSDDNHGWIAGGWIEPHTHSTTGVLLRTVDGGRHWTKVRNLTIPSIHTIRFQGPLSGWAIGNASPMHPSGIFKTSDGGRSWASMPNGHGKHWEAGDLAEGTTGVVARQDGTFALVTNQGLLEIDSPLKAPATPRQIHTTSAQVAVAVGEAGAAIKTNDGGRSWGPAFGKAQQPTNDHDLLAVDSHQQTLWIAGSPGSLVFRSRDAGSSWEAFGTPTSLPIHDLHFIDSNRGWAVGGGGTILATRDGGQSWQIQRAGTKRTAMLGIFADASSVPLELLAQACGNDGKIGTCIFPLDGATADSSSGQASTEHRTYDSMLSIGVSSVESTRQFPLLPSSLQPGTDELVSHWNSLHDGLAIRRLEERLVRYIRQYRPDVIITESTDYDKQHPERLLLNQLVTSAVKRSHDVNAFRSQISFLKLKPWRVSKVYAPTDVDRPKSIAIHATQVAPNLGQTLGEYTSYARSLVYSDFTMPVADSRLELLTSSVQTTTNGAHMFSGIPHLRLAETQRDKSSKYVESIRGLAMSAKRRSNLEQLILHMRHDTARQAAVLGQLYELTSDLTNDQAGDVIYEFSQRLYQIGKTELAATSLRHLLKRYPSHRNAEAAISWLTAYYGSDEIAWQHREEFARSAQTGVVPASAIETIGPTQPQRPDWKESQSPKSAAGQRLEKVKILQTFVKQTRPKFYSDPRWRFPVSSALRRSSGAESALPYYRHMTTAGGNLAWRRLAAYETWLHTQSGRAPANTWNCNATTDRPYLDGKFEDPTWEDADVIELAKTNGPNNTPSALKIAADDKFLYLAITCRKAQDFPYQTSDAIRPRDPDLQEEDRVRIQLDVDRDTKTAFTFTIDHRGWVHDECWHDASWNPKLYVASTQEDHFWAIEAAIPLDELTPHRPKDGDAWLTSVERLIPGVERQSWRTGSESNSNLDGLGLLLFR